MIAAKMIPPATLANLSPGRMPRCVIHPPRRWTP